MSGPAVHGSSGGLTLPSKEQKSERRKDSAGGGAESSHYTPSSHDVHHMKSDVPQGLQGRAVGYHESHQPGMT